MRLTILKRFESIYSGRGRKLYRNIVKILSSEKFGRIEENGMGEIRCANRYGNYSIPCPRHSR